MVEQLPSQERVACESQLSPASSGKLPQRPIAIFGIAFLALAVCFWKPLSAWLICGLSSDIYSHVLLIPAVSAYLIWSQRATLPRASQPSFTLALVPFLLGLAALLGYASLRAKGLQLQTENYLSITLFSFLCFGVSAGLLTLGRSVLYSVLFPIGLLLFAIPFPVFVLDRAEVFLQHMSAEAAHGLFTILQTPLFREGVVFHLPGAVIRVAEECSGIRSTLVLFLTSLIAGYMFLRGPWKRAVLTVAVIPLAIVRNAIRIVTIALLCIHDDPSWIHSSLHRRGGPLFFALSLVPFFLLLLWLRRSEGKAPNPARQALEGNAPSLP